MPCNDMSSAAYAMQHATSRACTAMVCRGVHANRRNTARQRCHRDPWRKETRFVGSQIWFREMKPEGLLNSMLKVFPCAEAEMKHVADAKADLPAVCARVQLCFDWTTCGRTVMSNMTELAVADSLCTARNGCTRLERIAIYWISCQAPLGGHGQVGRAIPEHYAVAARPDDRGTVRRSSSLSSLGNRNSLRSIAIAHAAAGGAARVDQQDECHKYGHRCWPQPVHTVRHRALARFSLFCPSTPVVGGRTRVFWPQ